MKKKRILYVSHEMAPYMPSSDIADIARKMPETLQGKGNEIRAFMPRYGLINERRHRLHEVVRLSGINIMIGDNDNPLIIKVASLQPARMQVYFLDNEDYFHRKATLRDAKGDLYADNDERMIFYCKGVLETVLKLGWAPDVVHCQGWFTSLIPMYIKKIYGDNPIFKNSKVVYSAYGPEFSESLDAGFATKARCDDMTAADLEPFLPGTQLALEKGAAYYADGVIMGNATVNPELSDYVMMQNNKAMLQYQDDMNHVEAYTEFYQKLLDHQGILI